MKSETTGTIEVEDKAVARLRASDKTASEDAEQDGRDAGREWASDVATAEQLRRLEASQDGAGTPDGFRQIVAPDEDHLEFWESAIGDDLSAIDGHYAEKLHSWIRGWRVELLA